MPPFSRGTSYVCNFCRHASNSTTRRLPEKSAAQAHAPKETKKWLKSSISDGARKTTEAPPKPGREPFSVRYRARVAHFTPKFLRQRPALRTFLKTLLVVAPITGFLLLHSPFMIPTINGPSMSPILNPNSSKYGDDPNDEMDIAIVQKWSPNDWRERNKQRAQLIQQGKYKRGQIVVYYGPHDPSKLVVKRIVGVPGDRVTPMKGYNGQEDPEPVVVQYNHLWVEGDINDRNRSWDSNWYGPISQNLVVGEVRAVYRPWKWWTIRSINYKQHSWPAKDSNRVEEWAVVRASLNPDVVSINDSWKNGKNEKVLGLLTERPEFVLKNFESSAKQRGQYRQFYMDAMLVVRGSEDQEKKALAAQIIRAMEDLFGKEVLREGRTVVTTDASNGKSEDSKKIRRRWQPPPDEKKQDKDLRENIANPLFFSDAEVHEHESARKRDERARPAKAALRKMIEQNRNLADEKQKEIDEMDQQREAKQGIASSFSLKGIFQSDEDTPEKE